MTITAGELLDRVLRAIGVGAVYGRPIAGVDVVPVDDAGVATLLATAHERVYHETAAAHLGGGQITVGTPSRDLTITRPADLVAITGGTRVRLDIDLDAPAPDVVPDAPIPAGAPTVDVLPALRAAAAPIGLVGPGVVADGAVAQLHAFAAAANLGVLNTWGAKGIFDWRSPHHLATVGLQARDLELGGVGVADLVVLVGNDPDETPAFATASVTVPTGSLGPLAASWTRPAAEISVPPLRTLLAEATQRGWLVERGPLPPSRVTRNYAECLGAGGLVAADAGVSGYWVARTFATKELDSAIVPGRATDGIAVACCVVARLRRPTRPVLAVVDGPLTP
ncbi:MAG: acetolactate synthase large subunit family protein, partial [Acidimicrobiales bacterium]